MARYPQGILVACPSPWDDRDELVADVPAHVPGVAATALGRLLGCALHRYDDVAEVRPPAGRQREGGPRNRRRGDRTAGMGRKRLGRQEWE